MFAMFQHLHPDNRLAASRYLSSIWGSLTTFSESYSAWNAPDGFDLRFKDYVEAEDARLKTNLEDVRYDIDGLDTLYLVIGPGRPEKVTLKSILNLSVPLI